MSRRRIFLCLAFLVISAAARADDGAFAARAISGDELELKDGRVLRLADIRAAGPEAAAYLQAHIAGHALILNDAATDRYGRVTATIFAEHQTQSVGDDMLAQGLAFVYPATGDVDALLAAERRARAAGIGYWSVSRDITAADAKKLEGGYGFVVGTVVKGVRVKNKFYLDFGTDWRNDFSVAIAAHDLRAFRAADKDPAAMEGRHLRVRGWVTCDHGPAMTLTDPHQLEILP